MESPVSPKMPTEKLLAVVFWLSAVFSGMTLAERWHGPDALLWFYGVNLVFSSVMGTYCVVRAWAQR